MKHLEVTVNYNQKPSETATGVTIKETLINKASTINETEGLD